MISPSHLIAPIGMHFFVLLALGFSNPVDVMSIKDREIEDKKRFEKLASTLKKTINKDHSFQQVSLSEVLIWFSDEFEVVFMFAENFSREEKDRLANQKITIQLVKGMTFETALEKTLSKLNLSFEREKTGLFLWMTKK